MDSWRLLESELFSGMVCGFTGGLRSAAEGWEVVQGFSDGCWDMAVDQGRVDLAKAAEQAQHLALEGAREFFEEGRDRGDAPIQRDQRTIAIGATVAAFGRRDDRLDVMLGNMVRTFGKGYFQALRRLLRCLQGRFHLARSMQSFR